MNSDDFSFSNQQENTSADSKDAGFLQALKKSFRRLTVILSKTSYDTNDEYRQFFLQSDVSQSRVIIALLALAIAGYIWGDYTFFGFSTEFYLLALLRASLVVYSILQVTYIGRLKNYRSYDLSTFIYLLVVVIGILTVNLTRPANFLTHIIIIDVAIFVFYLVIPIRFIFQVVPSLIFTFGELTVILLNFGSVPSMSGAASAILTLVFVNIVAFIASIRLHYYRWWIFQDILERRQTERLAAIGQTAGMIGHDIRNPLQAITSELYLEKQAASSFPEKDKDQAMESIDLIEEQTDYISKIVSDLQDYARPLKPEFSQVNFPKLVESIFQTIKMPSKILLKMDVEGLPQIQTDATLLRRALTNLVNNALQAMPDGGTLTLKAQKNMSEATILVSDTGVGIPEDVKPRLFTPLFTTKAKGQGLGLAVVKRFVEALNGTITFESQTGKGTTFTIHVPA